MHAAVILAAARLRYRVQLSLVRVCFEALRAEALPCGSSRAGWQDVARTHRRRTELCAVFRTLEAYARTRCRSRVSMEKAMKHRGDVRARAALQVWWTVTESQRRRSLVTARNVRVADEVKRALEYATGFWGVR